MTQPQSTPAPEPQEITIRLDIKVKMDANVANLTKLVESVKPVMTEAGKLGTVEAHAVFGRQKLAL
jgi:hypothetical protein